MAAATVEAVKPMASSLEPAASSLDAVAAAHPAEPPRGDGDAARLKSLGDAALAAGLPLVRADYTASWQQAHLTQEFMGEHRNRKVQYEAARSVQSVARGKKARETTGGGTEDSS